MNYILAFLEGIITFISPCMLPMLPIYISYFAADEAGNTRRTLKNALGFVLGFTLVFVLMGAFAASLGGLFVRHQKMVQLVAGIIVVLLGLSYLGIIRIPFLQGGRRMEMDPKKLHSLNFFSATLFGAIFSVGWTPCVSAFLGSALMMAASSGQRVAGVLMLLCFSLGLGIPFVASAVLVDRLKSAFDWIKRNYRVINTVSGVFLILVGVAMMTGWLGRLLGALNFQNW